ncbi:hypothetical protein CORC01_01893 [Colletotrichum orchidophilum]|uniref:Uncharacterized protein n=1 Tax=Colletotrichum orchidophilum TaxID=1209926 RepID=A0A1G4BMV1_9PEZI|nr:uncharacterized protein CORC01_01893 [Colletotrichum orchidophilum]OHF02792.1 hypothetical protein CORC01_01893 [Colletotrichum orchidophilum]
MTAPKNETPPNDKGPSTTTPTGEGPLRQRFAPDTQKPVAQIADPFVPFPCSPLVRLNLSLPEIGVPVCPLTRLQASNRLRENDVTPEAFTQWEPNDDCFPRPYFRPFATVTCWPLVYRLVTSQSLSNASLPEALDDIPRSPTNDVVTAAHSHDTSTNGVPSH